ncbi:hypothetical protein EDC04DRAFT_2753463 [Pisolithus marmoratus]|nr:hypothetical protein EDC04DRAFT_2753463 [Pisolithus marmoratus]
MCMWYHSHFSASRYILCWIMTLIHSSVNLCIVFRLHYSGQFTKEHHLSDKVEDVTTTEDVHKEFNGSHDSYWLAQIFWVILVHLRDNQSW